MKWLSVFLLLVVIASVSAVPNPGHTASRICGGIFGAADSAACTTDYTFPQSGSSVTSSVVVLTNLACASLKANAGRIECGSGITGSGIMDANRLVKFTSSGVVGESDLQVSSQRISAAIENSKAEIAGGPLYGGIITVYGRTDGSDPGEIWLSTDKTVAASFILFRTADGTNNVNTMKMVGGKVGIGIASVATPADKLQVLGDIRVGTTGTNGCVNNFGGSPIAGTCSSDARLKTNIKPVNNALDKVNRLQPVTFNWNTLGQDELHASGSETVYGLVAQDVEKVLPEFVTTGENGFKRVRYDIGLTMLLIGSVKEQQVQIQLLQKENADLKKRLDRLERR